MPSSAFCSWRWNGHRYRREIVPPCEMWIMMAAMQSTAPIQKSGFVGRSCGAVGGFDSHVPNVSATRPIIQIQVTNLASFQASQ